MMRCDEFRGRLDQLLDNRLDPEQDWMLTSHADNCEACYGALAEQQLLREAMDLFDHPVLSNSFADEVATVAIEQRHSTRRRKSQLLWFSGIAVAATLVVSFFLLSSDLRQGSVRDQVGRQSKEPLRTRATTPKTNQRNQLALNGGRLKRGGSASIEVVAPPRVPTKIDLTALRNFESDQIPGVRPLKTSLGVTISLLKQTIPGKSSPLPKHPATSQVVAEWWFPV